jgi:hypothetical protein
MVIVHNLYRKFHHRNARRSSGGKVLLYKEHLKDCVKIHSASVKTAFNLDTSSHKIILFSSGSHTLKASLPPNRFKRFTDMNLDKYFNSWNIQTSFANTQLLTFIF